MHPGSARQGLNFLKAVAKAICPFNLQSWGGWGGGVCVCDNDLHLSLDLHHQSSSLNFLKAVAKAICPFKPSKLVGVGWGGGGGGGIMTYI